MALIWCLLYETISPPQEAIRQACLFGLARFDGECAAQYKEIVSKMQPDMPHFHLPPLSDVRARVRRLLTFHLNKHYVDVRVQEHLQALFLGPGDPVPASVPLHPKLKFAGLLATWEELKGAEPSNVILRTKAGMM